MSSTTASTRVRTVICRGGLPSSRSTFDAGARTWAALGLVAPPGLLVGFELTRAAPLGAERDEGWRLTPPSCRIAAAVLRILRVGAPGRLERGGSGSRG